MTFPELDEWGTPTAKLPDCPQCGEDELGVIHSGLLMCYRCGWELRREMPLGRCQKCGRTMMHSRLEGYQCLCC